MKRKKLLNFFNKNKNLNKFSLKSINYFDNKFFLKNFFLIYYKLPANIKIKILSTKFFFYLKNIFNFFPFFSIKNVSFFFFFNKSYLSDLSKVKLIFTQIGFVNFESINSFFLKKKMNFLFNFNFLFILKVLLQLHILFIKFFFILNINCYYLSASLLLLELE